MTDARGIGAKSGIYAIVNPINNKMYIGQSQNIGLRLTQHRCALKSGKHTNKHLQRAYNILVKANLNFEYKIIELCSVDELNLAEVKWIDFHNTCDRNLGYNLKTGGDRDCIYSEESRQKMRDAMIGRFVGDKNPMFGVTSPFKGKHHSDAAKAHRRRKMLEWGESHPMANAGEKNGFFGRTHSDETKAALSQKHKEYYKTHESYRIHPVVCLNDDGSILARYKSVGAAALVVNRSYATISGACSGRQHTCLGYKWMYESDYLAMIGGEAENAS